MRPPRVDFAASAEVLWSDDRGSVPSVADGVSSAVTGKAGPGDGSHDGALAASASAASRIMPARVPGSGGRDSISNAAVVVRTDEIDAPCAAVS